MRPGPSVLSFEYLLRKFLAQLYTPLVEAVDVPQHALHEHLVLIERDQPAEVPRVEPFELQQARGPIARILPVRRQGSISGTESKGVRLRAAIGGQVLLQAEVDEVDRHRLRPLMQELVEGMLAHRALEAPQHR